ncbi:MAG: hypothetical protein GY811_06450 [Myxococcales bacterium]|nr:hypothetical protein [Myxococcales bacterium]
MGIARHLQLRWIWLSVYLIAGCLSSAYIVFALLDSLPSGIFFAGFGGACFIGAFLTTLHAGGARVAESGIAALAIGALNLAFLLVAARGDTVVALDRFSVPLSTTVICFAGALAGGQLGARRQWHDHVADSRLRLAITALLVLIGAGATHAGMIVVVAFFVPTLWMLFAGISIMLFFITPAVAGAALQLSTKKDVTPAFAYGSGSLAVAFLVPLLLEPYALANPGKVIAMTLLLALGTFVTVVLVAAGASLAEHPSNGQPATTVPPAVLVTPNSRA